jgi:hypothetical protein
MNETEKYYMTEGCPYYAIALHEATGFRLAMLVDDAVRWAWGRKKYPTIAHVFVVTPKGGAIDVMGRRSIESIKRDFFDLVRPRILPVTANDLKKHYMGSNKPLYAYSEAEMEEARRLVERRLKR